MVYSVLYFLYLFIGQLTDYCSLWDISSDYPIRVLYCSLLPTCICITSIYLTYLFKFTYLTKLYSVIYRDALHILSPQHSSHLSIHRLSLQVLYLPYSHISTTSIRIHCHSPYPTSTHHTITLCMSYLITCIIFLLSCFSQFYILIIPSLPTPILLLISVTLMQ